MSRLSGPLRRDLVTVVLAGAALLPVLAVAGCTPAKEEQVKPTGPAAVSPIPFDPNVGKVYGYETMIGTTKVYCLVYDGDRAGGLHCFTWQEVGPW